MKEMIKRVREEKGGFTLAELLIVVAIILVLVAVAVPVFTGAMDSANRSVGYAAGHSVKSAAVATHLLNNANTGVTTATTYTATVDKNGNVGPVTAGTAGTDATNLDDPAALKLGQAITSSTTPTAVQVTITPTDVTPPATKP